MTIFVATLFLPYTVNFKTPPSQVRSPETSESQSIPLQFPLLERSPVSILGPTTPGSLIQSPGQIVQTPGTTTGHEKIFRPAFERPFHLSLPKSRPTTADQARDPRSFSRADLHSPGWGKAISWNQPTSRAKSPPPSSILKHAPQSNKDRTAAVMWAAQSRHKARQRSRTVSRERQFSENDHTIEKTQIGNGGLFNAIDAATEAGILTEKTWVGTPGMPTDALEEHLKESISELLENDYESLVVYPSDSDLNGHYEHFCKTILWPVFHYQIPDHPKSKAYEDHSWCFYEAVNKTFADRIVRNYKKGDTIWVHDYHLLLVPRLLREKLPEAEIGFYLHTAFPSSEIFRTLAARRILLDGMLGANTVAFQNEEYGHHFLQTCSRLLNVEVTTHGIILEDGRFVHVNTVPIGIDPLGLNRQRQLPEVAEWVSIIKEKYKGKKLIVARDKLDNIGGVSQKILAYELFLSKYPEYKERVVLIQIATSSNDDADLSATVADIVTRVNSTYSTLAHQPLVFLKQDIDFAQYLALLSVADCLVITSLREGMNLSCHEYVVCQDGRYSEAKFGPLVLSEFTGSGTVLGDDALLVNPWHYTKCAEAFKIALDMSNEERERRWKGMHATVLRHNATEWFDACLRGLKHAWEDHAVRDASSVPRYPVAAAKRKYQNADSRLIILDYEGTLASWVSPTDIISTTPKRSVDILNVLIEDKRNHVYVMSSRMRGELERLFKSVPGLGLIAENGAFLRQVGFQQWEELVDMNHIKGWKKGVRKILQYYVDRIEGSKIEERQAALIFDYAKTDDKDGAFRQAGECASHINDVCAAQYVSAIPIDNGLIVSGMDINKGAAVRTITDRIEKQGQSLPDFMLVIGYSREDEYVFNWVHKLEKAGKVRDVVTVTLGARNTEASATMTQGVTGVLSNLEKLAGVLHSPKLGTGQSSPKLSISQDTL